MSWSLRQSSWLRNRVLGEGGGEYIGLFAWAAKPVGILAANSDGRLTLWRQQRGGASQEDWGAAPAKTRMLAGHHTSGRLALAGVYGLQQWDLLQRAPIAIHDGGGMGGLDVAVFTAVDASLFTGGRDGFWRWWVNGASDETGLTPTWRVAAHTKPIRALAPHPRGECLVSAGGDHALRVWSWPSGFSGEASTASRFRPHSSASSAR